MSFEKTNSEVSTAGPAGTSEQQEQSARSSPRRKRRYVGAAQVSLVLERQERRCALTGRPLRPSTAFAEFAVPLTRGGKPIEANLRIVHVDAHKARGQMLDAEFLQLCREIISYADRSGGLQS